jgi:hypothetical protein
MSMSFSNEPYDPETVALMGRVYDSALKALETAGIPFPEAIKPVMARRILGAVAAGEREVDRLMQHALEAINSYPAPAPRVSANTRAA